MKGKKKIIIAIDGPAASGKSTTAREVAKRLGYLYIDTGAMYRALTLEVLNKDIAVSDEETIVQLAGDIEIKLTAGDGEPLTFLNGVDVSEEIRLPKVTKVISTISAYKEIRHIMKVKQRELAKHGGVVMDGRDIGTVVLPHADVKIYMQASVEERTRRRVKELMAKGIEVDPDKIKKEIIRRDALDSSRDIAPLKPAADAYIIDTSNMSINHQVNKVLKIIKKYI